MEENTEFELGVCKFCLSEGRHKDIAKEYWDDGEREKYCDIILECFKIFISTSGCSKALICADCVTRLRSAVLFRKLVLQAAQDLNARIQDTPVIVVSENGPVAIKTELKTEPGFEIDIVEHGIQYVTPELRAASGLTAGQQREPNKGNKKRVAPYPSEDSTIDVRISPNGYFWQVQFSRMHIFQLWHLAQGSQEEKKRFIMEKVLEVVPDIENVEIGVLSKRVSYISKLLAAYWKKSGRTRRDLVKKHEKWLNIIETIDIAKNVTIKE